MKRRNLSFLAAFACLLLTTTAVAEEGMWTFEDFPSDAVAKQFGFSPSAPWLGYVRLGSVRFNSGGSGSFVSPTGLVLTNHHVAADCLTKLGTKDRDVFRSGYLAQRPEQELQCPDLELNVLIATNDVTAAIESASASAEGAKANELRRAAIAKMEKECADRTGLRCDVVTLYQGGRYSLYTYRKYTDIRLVWSPELQIAFFGGDTDNFEYPRHCLDAAILRAYDGGKPVVPPAYFPLSESGAAPGEPVFVSGNPGRTSRLLTSRQLEVLDERVYALYADAFERMQGALTQFAELGEEQKRQAQEELFGVQNGIKAIGGYLRTLRSDAFRDAQSEAEKRLREQLQSSEDPKIQALASAWKDVERAQNAYESFVDEYLLLERALGLRSELFRMARRVLRLTVEVEKPNGERLRGFGDAQLESLKTKIFGDVPFHPDLEIVKLTTSFTLLRDTLGRDHPTVEALLSGQSPDEAAKAYVSKTRLSDAAYRKELVEGGRKAVETSKDPLLRLARLVDPASRAVRKRYEDEVQATERKAAAGIAQARFLLANSRVYPDATFTLRLSYGEVKGYELDGETVEPYTTVEQLYAKGTGQEPYVLPKSWVDAKTKIAPETRLNFVTTNDIIGGNSGSPIVNRQGELVGLVFDGNRNSLGWNFAFQQETGRTVAVHSRGILEALRVVYHAKALAAELAAESRP